MFKEYVALRTSDGRLGLSWAPPPVVKGFLAGIRARAKMPLGCVSFRRIALPGSLHSVRQTALSGICLGFWVVFS